MSMNFPNVPVPGQIYASPGGPVYRFDDPVWSPVPAPGSAGVDIRQATVSPFDFGGIGDGVADDTFAIQQAIDFLFTSFRSGTVDMSGGRWLVDSADILVKSGVQLVGSWNNVGEVAGGTYLNLRSSIILNPLYTINLAEDFSGIKGMAVLNKNLQTPTSNRHIRDMADAFAGTAITVGVRTGVSGAANDSYVGYCLVIGFQYAYWSDLNERVTIEYLRGDNTNGVYLKRCYDMNHMSHCHMWGYLASHMTFPDGYFWAISGAANNGSGLIRLTLASNWLRTGDIITVIGVTGATQANGRWTVTVIDATHVDLQGSAFSSAYVSGGTLYAHPSIRRGTAYNFPDDVDWGQADHCFSWGYDIGFNIESLAHAELLNCGTDHAAQIGDPTTIGFRLKDVDSVKLIGCKSAATAYGIYADAGNTGNGGNPVMVTGHDFWGNGICGLKQVTGRTNITASSQNGGVPMIDIDPASWGVRAIANRCIGAATPVVCPAGQGQRASYFHGNDWADPSAMGNQMVFGNTQRDYKWDSYDDTDSSMLLAVRKARGTPTTPTAAQNGDKALQMRGDFWDGAGAFRTGASYRMVAVGATTPTSSPGQHIWQTTASGSVIAIDRLVLNSTALFPAAHRVMSLGTSTLYFESAFLSYPTLRESVPTPTAVSGGAQIWVDSGGAVKIMTGAGVIKTFTVT